VGKVQREELHPIIVLPALELPPTTEKVIKSISCPGKFQGNFIEKCYEDCKVDNFVGYAICVESGEYIVNVFNGNAQGTY
jgi:hypothetical protein